MAVGTTAAGFFAPRGRCAARRAAWRCCAAVNGVAGRRRLALVSGAAVVAGTEAADAPSPTG
jgi:hypothetical protein